MTAEFVGFSRKPDLHVDWITLTDRDRGGAFTKRREPTRAVIPEPTAVRHATCVGAQDGRTSRAVRQADFKRAVRFGLSPPPEGVGEDRDTNPFR